MNLSTLDENVAIEFARQECDHEGHSQCTLAMYPDKFRFTESHGWLVYTGTHYSTIGARQAAERAITNVLQMRRSYFAVMEDMKKAKACMSYRHNVTGSLAQMAKDERVFADISEFDESLDKLNCQGGVVCLKTGTIEPHSGEQLYTYCLPVRYEPQKMGKNIVQWLAFLKSCELSDELIDYLRLALGYTLTGRTNEEILFYCFGPTRSGKGTFTETVNMLMGELSTGVDMTTFTATRTGDTSSFDLAPLKNKRMITASESKRNGQSINPAVIKRITGGDPIYCSFKRKDHFSYLPQFKIWLSSNFGVNTDVDDDAAWGRLRVIPFKKSHIGKEDKGLKSRLRGKKSLAAILAWMVSGAIDWYAMGENGLNVPSEIKQETDSHRNTLDSVGQFLDERITRKNDGSFIVGRVLYATYKDWCEDEGHLPFGRKRFTSSLATRGIETVVKRVGAKSERVYMGVSSKVDSVDL